MGTLRILHQTLIIFPKKKPNQNKKNPTWINVWLFAGRYVILTVWTPASTEALSGWQPFCLKYHHVLLARSAICRVSEALIQNRRHRTHSKHCKNFVIKTSQQSIKNDYVAVYYQLMGQWKSHSFLAVAIPIFEIKKIIALWGRSFKIMNRLHIGSLCPSEEFEIDALQATSSPPPPISQGLC